MNPGFWLREADKGQIDDRRGAGEDAHAEERHVHGRGAAAPRTTNETLILSTTTTVVAVIVVVLLFV